MGNTLFQFADDFREVIDYIEANDLTVDELKDTLDALEVNFADKAENVIKYSIHLGGLAKIQDEEAKLLTEASKKNVAKAESLIKYLDQCMQVAKLKELQAGVYSLKYHKGREVVKVDLEKLPKAYYYVPVLPEPKPYTKPELKKLIDEGFEIPGVQIVRNPDSLKVKR